MMLTEPPIQVFLSRRNLLTLLSKLDRVKAGESSFQTIVKHDTKNRRFSQSHPRITVTAVEDEDYYSDRNPGPVHPKDKPRS